MRGSGVRRTTVAFALSVVVSALAACGGSDGNTSAGDATTDKLAQVLARGTLVGYHESDYPPQSMDVPDATRPAGSKCADNQLTANQVTGFDSDTTKLVARQLGVEACFATPTFTELTAGNWGDRLDIGYASGSINSDRMQRLWMTQPYYAVPNYYFVAVDSPARHAADLNGKRIGACTGCSHELYLNGQLEIPGIDVKLNVEKPKVIGYETEGPGLRAAAARKIDAFLAAGPVGQALIDDGVGLRRLPEVAFTYYPSGFVDKSSGLTSKAFVDKVDAIIQTAQQDGTLRRLSLKYFGQDYVRAAAAYDIAALKQEVE
jgi:polar amino acid transport system substrate-binding protein